MEQAVEKARKAWEAAPLHVRAMAGAYVDPLIVALLEIASEVERIKVDNEVFQAGKMFGLRNPEAALEMLSSAVAEKLKNGAPK